MDATKFEGLVRSAVEKFEGQGTVIDQMKLDMAKMLGSIETLTAMNPAGPRFIQKSRGVEVPWETKEHAVEFARFMKAVARKDEAFIAKALGDAMNEDTAGAGSQADGGYLVPVEFKPTLLRIIEQYGVIRGEAQIIPMTRDEMQFPVYNGVFKDQNGGATGPCYWVDENTDITKSWPQFANITMQCRKLAALIPTSNELLQDAALPIATLIATLVGEFLAKEEDRVGFVGTTVGNADKFDGCLTAAGVTVTTATTDIKDVTANDLLDMTVSLPRSAVDGAKFYMHRTVFNILRKLATTDGLPIYNPPALGAPATIWGFPYTLCESMPSYDGAPHASKRYILFANLKNFYMGDRMGLQVASTDIVGFAAFQTHFRFVERIGFKAVLPGTMAALRTHA